MFPLLLAMGLFSLAARRVVDPDLWWHLRTGQLTLQNHAVFHADPFSFTRAGQPWINHEWLSSALMFALYRATGWGGLIAASAALIAAAYYLAFRRSPGRPYLAGILTVWAALASLPVWDVRPQVLSIFFASVLLMLYDRSAASLRILWWAVPLMLLWVNLHAGFALGIVLLALFLFGECLEKASRPRLPSLALIFLACLAVIPLNPYGFQMYAYPFSTLRSISMQSHIAEWFSPNFHQPQYLPLALLILASLAALSLSPRRLRPVELLLLLAATLGALLSARHIAIYCLVAAPILAGLLDGMFTLKSRARPISPGRSALINLLMLFLFAAFVVFHLRDVIQRQPETVTKQFPVKAVDFLAGHRLPGPLLNHYDWGGYLIWRLYPGTPVFIDGRADLYGDPLMKDFGDVTSLRGDWRSVLDRWKIRAVMLPADSPLITALKASGEWNQIYADSQAAILTR